jgi:radical SAM protein with 4Fe4S-binding SPASM domain
MIEFSVDADNEEDYNVVRKGLSWSRLLRNVDRILELRNNIGSESKIVASGVDQCGIDIDRVEKFWIETVGVDYFIKRKFLTWGTNTSLDDSRSANRDPYIDVESVPCPFIFERLNIDSRGNVMVCGYDIAANTSMGNVGTQSIRDIWHGEGFEFYRTKHLALQGSEISLCRSCPDWKYRSWTHNYWKTIEGAARGREQTLFGLKNEEDFMSELSD